MSSFYNLNSLEAKFKHIMNPLTRVLDLIKSVSKVKFHSEVYFDESNVLNERWILVKDDYSITLTNSDSVNDYFEVEIQSENDYQHYHADEDSIAYFVKDFFHYLENKQPKGISIQIKKECEISVELYHKELFIGKITSENSMRDVQVQIRKYYKPITEEDSLSEYTLRFEIDGKETISTITKWGKLRGDNPFEVKNKMIRIILGFDPLDTIYHF